MPMAIDEAVISLREGNCGFGVVIVKGNQVIARAHDTEKTSGDPTAHAEMTAIRSAASQLGRDLTGCAIVSTHEPCPMCATAILWSGIKEISYGYTIKEALKQGRKRIDLSCKELFDRAGKDVRIHEAVLHDACSVLYDQRVRQSIDLLRDADEKKLKALARKLSQKRLKWYADNFSSLSMEGIDVIDMAYHVFLRKLDITEEQAPVVRRDEKHLVLHSRNFCPTLEACTILKCDPRFVCRHLTEQPTTDLLRQIHPSLCFSRNYDRLRPHCEYCEETIIFEK
jgi:tRNA(adenine34) deaminase